MNVYTAYLSDGLPVHHIGYAQVWNHARGPMDGLWLVVVIMPDDVNMHTARFFSEGEAVQHAAEFVASHPAAQGNPFVSDVEGWDGSTVLLNVGEFLVSLGYYGKEVLMRGRFALPPGKRPPRRS